jgi:hypothetical protein
MDRADGLDSKLARLGQKQVKPKVDLKGASEAYGWANKLTTSVADLGRQQARPSVFVNGLTAAQSRTSGLLADLRRVDSTDPRPTVGAPGLSTTQARTHNLLADLRRLDGETFTTKVRVLASGSGITVEGGSLMSIKLASGGYVSGPGTATSDSIRALLSNGEFVNNAQATKMWRPLLEAANRGLKPSQLASAMASSAPASSTAPAIHIEHFESYAQPNERAEVSVPRALRTLIWQTGLVS